jgi:drug/metabolite transporter (DMT)-like permease
VPVWGKFAVVALVALALTLLPGGRETINALLTVLSIGFFVAIALLVVRMFRQNRSTIESLEPRQRLVLYSSVGLALLTFAATNRLFDQGGFGVLVWLALLGLATYGIYWVWTQYRRYAL